LEELSVDGRIMLKFIFEKYVMMGTGIRWFRIGSTGRLFWSLTNCELS
jgi:hypothetical protein